MSINYMSGGGNSNEGLKFDSLKEKLATIKIKGLKLTYIPKESQDGETIWFKQSEDSSGWWVTIHTLPGQCGIMFFSDISGRINYDDKRYALTLSIIEKLAKIGNYTKIMCSQHKTCSPYFLNSGFKIISEFLNRRTDNIIVILEKDIEY